MMKLFRSDGGGGKGGGGTLFPIFFFLKVATHFYRTKKKTQFLKGEE